MSEAIYIGGVFVSQRDYTASFVNRCLDTGMVKFEDQGYTLMLGDFTPIDRSFDDKFHDTVSTDHGNQDGYSYC